MATDEVANSYPKRSATADELAGRIVVLETLLMVALGMLARGPKMYSPENIIRLLNSVKLTIPRRLIGEGVPAAAEAEANRYADEVLSLFSAQLIPKKPL